MLWRQHEQRSPAPSQRDDLRRWDDEGGASRSGHPSHGSHFAPKHEAEPAPYEINLRTEGTAATTSASKEEDAKEDAAVGFCRFGDPPVKGLDG